MFYGRRYFNMHVYVGKGYVGMRPLLPIMDYLYQGCKTVDVLITLIATIIFFKSRVNCILTHIVKYRDSLP